MPRLRAKNRRAAPVFGVTEHRQVRSLPLSALVTEDGSPPPRFVVSEPNEYRRYWLERFTLDEIQRLAREF